ncbi:MAG TPA: hypothetical protein VLJ62_13090 [Burkholderiaceae bacterium]|nr:hypothetical protein [Burkholderiaceae bacterium]
MGGVRVLLPLIELYAARRSAEGEGADEKGSLGFKRGEQAVLRAAGEKAFLEMVEIASHTHPVFEGAPVFSAAPVEGRVATPHLVHLLALAAAAEAFWDERFGDAEPPPPPPPPPSVPPEQSVVFIAAAPGEYAMRSGPMTPREIRRISMRQRSFTPPPQAVLSSAPNARALTLSRADGGTAESVAYAAHAQPAYPVRKGGGSGRAGGCGCGKGSAATCSCGKAATVARYDEDGSCASPLDVSCDARWRIRECFQVAICDLLRCVGDQLCEDGQLAPKPDLGACLEGFVCSLVTCLPDAICPPPAKPCPPCGSEPCLPAPGASSCACNYAVGE